ncbi:STAS domain-containing protein [Leptolyngbya sp. AN02str]|uniref:STAS domain-containing protein n=1 Tax=Leptolyngbya sp. AN02str TaxID=3423363 RepID=UPI003D310438
MQMITPSSFMNVFKPEGHINASNAAQLQQELSDLVTSVHCDSLIVDMSEVESLDSAGLMALVATLNRAQQLHKTFGICKVPPSIQIIFELTQLDQAFNIFDQVPMAEASLN